MTRRAPSWRLAEAAELLAALVASAATVEPGTTARSAA
jgi:hypothetical protein